MSKRVFQVMTFVVALTGAFVQAAFAVDFNFTDYDVSAPGKKIGYFGKDQAAVAHATFQFGELRQGGHKLAGLNFGLGGAVETGGVEHPYGVHGGLSLCTPEGLVCAAGGGSLSNPHGLAFGWMFDAGAAWNAVSGAFAGGTAGFTGAP